MNRRNFTAVAGAGVLGAPVPAEPAAPAVVELRWIKLHNGPENQMQRTSDLLQHAGMPALQRAGAGPIGVFASVIGLDSPFLLELISYPSLAAMESIRAKMAADPEYRKARDSYNMQPGQGFQRIENSVGRCFRGAPAVEVLPVEPARPARIFELRTYESNNATTLARKVQMFEDGEMGIFRRLGMRPVFFAETMVGQRMPNLVYMLSYDDLTARDKLWKAFGSDPEWQKLRTQPGLADSEIVSNISNVILRPLAFSMIR